MTAAGGRLPLLVRLRAAGTVAAASLRLYWAGALVVVALGFLGLSVQTPIRSLGKPSQPVEPLLRLADIPAADAGITVTAASQEPGAVQAAAVRQLYQLLAILGWGALIIAGIAMLTRFAAQAEGRGPEVGVRRAAGASRRDLLLSLLVEGGVLLLAVLALGLPASALIVRLSVAAWPGVVPGAGLLPRAAALLLGSVIAFGALAPLRYGGTRFMRGGADGRVMLAVPAFQLAMSLAILMGSAALLRRAPPSSAAPAAGPAGPAILLSLETTGSSPERRSSSIAALLDSMGRIPGVAGASLTSPGTLLGLGRVDNVTTDCGACMRGGIYQRFDLHTAAHYLVSPDTFAQQGIRLISGRGFTTADRWEGRRVAVVSRHLAVSGFEAAGAVGRDVYLGDDWPNRPYQVIGVVEDTRPAGVGGALEPLDTIYLSVLQHPPKRAELLVRGGQAGLRDSSLAALVPGRVGPAWTVRPLGSPTEALSGAVRPVRWFGTWFTVVGLVVLVAALAGTFGTMQMWVASCAAEVAARRAVGATRIRIVGWVLRHTAGTGIKGVLVGMFVYVSVLRVSLTNLVGPVPAWDPALFGALAGLLLGAAAMGAVIPTLGLLRKPIASLFT